MIKALSGFLAMGLIFFSSGATLDSEGTHVLSHSGMILENQKPTLDGYKQPLLADVVLRDISVEMERKKVFSLPETQIIPRIQSKAFLLGDPASGKILFAKNEESILSIGSITKLMTAVVAMEHFSLDDEVLISHTAASLEGAKIKFISGEKVRLSDLLIATLVRSGNDGAYAIAEHAPLGKDQFVGWMNEKAQMLGMHSSHFSNPMGFDEPGNYSTARDLFILAQYLLSTQPFLKDAVAHESYDFTATTGRVHHVDSTNELFKSFLKIKGMKTGTTEDAGESFMGLAENENGAELIALVLGSPDRFQEAKTLFWWGMSGK